MYDSCLTRSLETIIRFHAFEFNIPQGNGLSGISSMNHQLSSPSQSILRDHNHSNFQHRHQHRQQESGQNGSVFSQPNPKMMFQSLSAGIAANNSTSSFGGFKSSLNCSVEPMNFYEMSETVSFSSSTPPKHPQTYSNFPFTVETRHPQQQPQHLQQYSQSSTTSSPSSAYQQQHHENLSFASSNENFSSLSSSPTTFMEENNELLSNIKIPVHSTAYLF